MAIFSTALDIWLLHMEQNLRQRLDSGETPFLGLYADLFSEVSCKKLEDALKVIRDPFQTYLRGLEKWPAVLAAYLTVNVVHGYGAEGNAAVWPFVTKAVLAGDRALTPVDQEKLWRAYRRACVRLGLDVIPPGSVSNYMVAEFLHQAGVPVRYLPKLARRMLRHADAAGVPDIEDPEALSLWQTALLDRLGPPVPVTVARAIQNDGNSYYASFFLQALAEAPADSTVAESSLYTCMVETIAAAGADRRHVLSRGLAIPKVVWRDDFLGVELPAGSDTPWRIDADGTVHEYRGDSESRFTPLDFPPLPGRVRIERADGTLTKSFDLWEDGRNNRFLVFDATGLLAASSCLNVEEPVLVEPGVLTLVTRFRPQGDEESLTELNSDPALYRLSMDIGPGDHLQLKRGPAEVTIVARSRPVLGLDGQAFRGVGGNELFASADLILRGRIPVELLVSDETTQLVVTLGAVGLGDPIHLPVEPDDRGRFELNIERVESEWKPGLARLRIELRRVGLRRTMARLATWLWNGLDRIEGRTRFYCSRLPGNLDRDLSDNLAPDEARGVITYRSDAKRFFRLVFRQGDSRSVQFTGTVPGAFMVLKRFREGGVLEQPLRKGAVLALRPDSREVLEVHSCEGGVLTLGDMRQEIPVRSGMRRLHLSTLAQYLEPGANKLCIELPSGILSPLLQLVTPHRVLGSREQRDGRRLSIQFGLPAPVEALRCTVLDMLSGTELALDATNNDVAARLDSRSLVWLSCGERQVNGRFNHTLELPLDRWRDGAWLLQVEARLQGHWGSLVNERDDVYAWGFLLGDNGIPMLRQELEHRLAEFDPLASIKIFKRVHRALLPCYAPEVWNGVAWLAAAWRQLVYAFEPADGQVLIDLLALDAMAPPETGQRSWFPLLLPGVAMPWIYARAAASYRGVGAGLIRKLKNIRTPLCELFFQHYLEPTVAFGFGNVMQMQRGVPPNGFSMDRYRTAMAARNLDDAWSQLKREDWQPTEGDYLGPVHWRYALGRLDARYMDTLAGNEARRGRALKLLQVSQAFEIGDLCGGLPANLLRTGGLGLLTEMPADGWPQQDQNLLDITRFLCLFAAVCRWEARHPGVLATWEQAMAAARIPDSDALQQALGYLIFVGRDVFEFYLMLWELLFAADADVTEEE